MRSIFTLCTVVIFGLLTNCRISTFSNTTKPPRIFYIEEHPDSLIFHEEAKVSLNTLRNTAGFMTALASELGENAFSYVSGIDTVLSLKFPEDGFNTYRWKNVRFGSEELGMVVLNWGKYVYEDIDLSFYGKNGLPLKDLSKIKPFLEALVKKHLLSQPIIHKPMRTVRNLSEEEITRYIQPNWSTLQPQIDALLKEEEEPGYYSYTIHVDSIGQKTLLDTSNLPTAVTTLVQHWADTSNFPILVYKEARDTVQYLFDLELHRSDDCVIGHIKQQYRAGKLSEFSENNNSFTPFAVQVIQGGIIPKEEMGTPYPLLAVFAQKAHFFLINGDHFIPAGSIQYADYVNVKVKDYDFDQIPELQLESGGNMNGNTWSSLARWNKDSQQMEYAGSFCTEMEVDTVHQLWKEHYVGSWYMAQHETIYGWSQHKLTPIEKIEIRLREGDMIPDNCCIVSLFRNPVFHLGLDSLQLVQDTFVVENDEDLYQTTFFKQLNRK